MLQEGTPRESLVKFEQPIEGLNIESKAGMMKGAKFPAGVKRKQQLPPLESRPKNEDILNAILPPREWVENDIHYIQYVSHQKASREDVDELAKLLDQKMNERQARESGICPVREELFSQCFDELIRQVTIDCEERGLLLLRVRDEIKMTIAAYQTLYQSSVIFGIRKQLQAEHGKADLEKSIEDLETKKLKLENKVIELKAKIEAIQKRNLEKRTIDESRRKEELEFLKYQHEHLTKFLKAI